MGISAADQRVTERVGNIDMSMRINHRTDESDERWQRRSEVLAAWLIEQWQREQRRRLAERN